MTVKVWTFLITTLLLVTGCSKSEVVTTYEQEVAKQEYVKQQPAQQEVNNSPVPVVFDVASGNQATTRASAASISRKADLADEGFSVFAYLTGATDYVSTSGTGSQPNFMYNQKVTGTVVHDDPVESNVVIDWSYSPVKYWPNDYNGNGGAVDNQTPPATGTKVEKLSFFAYAPHVDLKKVGGSFVEYDYDADNDGISDAFQTNLSTGIVAISNNTYGGDPFLIYDLGSTASSGDMRDLLYATNNVEDGDTTDDTTNKNKTDGPISFNFNHALAGFSFGVCGIFNEVVRGGHTGDNYLINNDSYIRIEKIELTVSLSQKAILNLRTGVFTPEAATTTTLTLSGDQIAENLRYPSFDESLYDTDEAREAAYISYRQGLADLLEYGVGRYYAAIDNSGGAGYTDGAPIPNSPPGNIYQRVAVSKDDNNNYRNNLVYFIPATSQPVTIKIIYHTLTEDSRMQYGYSDVKNVCEVTTPTPLDLNIAKGSIFSFNLQLGMTKAKFDVAMAGHYWDSEGAASTPWNGNWSSENSFYYTIPKK